ncbi:hypothetical protein KP509_35G004400 [Ceratopteris richardii]|uniref:PPM-type phosphatase domain-containing protein n=1 Tax=Ceratopteris richardii TaxID=49495 RepID=A0A8T2QDJ5_CERRI|nr:hypothetical protein KP509_35G004400 [Ceratopteris richardii]
MTDLPLSSWRRAILRLLLKIRAWSVIVPDVEVQLFDARRLEYRTVSHSSRRKSLGTQRPLSKTKKNAPKVDKARKNDSQAVLDSAILIDNLLDDVPHKFVRNGGSNQSSLFSKQGMKGINQDTMIVLEDFASQTGTIFCGVFDGHGPDGHLVSERVRDSLPEKLAACWQDAFTPLRGQLHERNGNVLTRSGGDPQLIMAWKESLIRSYKQTDRDLLGDEFDCTCSGTTAVTLVKQGNDLYIGNVGDSRAVLAMTTDENSLMPLQLTIDLKPNLRNEAERIRRFKGRVFALRNEPSVKRVWLPNLDAPGLAMARSLGDYCLKKFGVISDPVITYRKLSARDRFIVLASDGVWDVLSNEQVVQIVASVSDKRLAAEAVVEAARRAWKLLRPQSRVDDCTAVCLFLDDLMTSSTSAFRAGNEGSRLRKSRSSGVALHRMVRIDKSASCSELELLAVTTSEDTKTASGSIEVTKKRKLLPLNTEVEGG